MKKRIYEPDLFIILDNMMRLNYWECDFQDWDSFIAFWNELDAIANKLDLTVYYHQRLA